MQRIYLALALSLLLPALAHAQADESPQRFALEIKFGPYVPHIDDSPGLGGNTPFSDLFGDKDAPKGALPSYSLLSQVEFDYQFFRRFGTLGVGLSAGFFQKKAPQIVYFDAGTQKRPCEIRSGGEGQPRQFFHPTRGLLTGDEREVCFSGDDNTVNFVPLSLLLVYRFDYLARRLHIPLIPYAKVGVSYAIWWLGTSGELVSEVRYNNGSSVGEDARVAARGGTFGLVVLPGLALDLGAIDRQAARVMDRELGLNRVTAFVEANLAWLNNFGVPGDRDGRPTTLTLSDTIFSAGLGFEF